MMSMLQWLSHTMLTLYYDIWLPFWFVIYLIGTPLLYSVVRYGLPWRFDFDGFHENIYGSLV